MNNTIKMQKKNEDGKIIVKEIPLNLESLYKNLGWEVVKATTVKSNIEMK